MKTLELGDLRALFEELARRGFTLVGPTVRDDAIVYDEIESIDDLPVGWTDEQDGGVYRLRRRDDEALFGYVVGPHSWKTYLFPPRLRLWRAERGGDSFRVLEEPPDDTAYALIGVRSCELHAIAIQDRVFLEGASVDPVYRQRRDSSFVVAVQCAEAGGTCFCVSMNTGPRADSGFDLALTEIVEKPRHYFVVESASARGEEVLAALPTQQATDAERAAAAAASERAAGQMGRTLDTDGIRELLAENLENPRWDAVAERCLACSNCTLVCPTCFCSTVEDVTDLTGDVAERWRTWDSCFTSDFSYLHGGSVRTSIKSRYRQWATHKLGTWIDQFGTSGCVGCGRCITWCPVGIDLTEEVRLIRDSDHRRRPEDASLEETA
ncbi:MAG: 4Fe-4S dicluster domain-containing protein [Acidobacteriota bacterium]